MKRIVYLTFYFQPDLSAGSFRNSTLAFELAKLAESKNVIIDLYTTQPNRYSSYEITSLEFERYGNLRIHRIILPSHKNGMIDQILSFQKFYFEILKLNKGGKADLVFASSGRLFTAFLGYQLSRKLKAKLYLDIRDIFLDTIKYVLKSWVLKISILPLLRIIERKTFTNAEHINLISGGFQDYFLKFNKPTFSFFTNGIDEEFISSIEKSYVIRKFNMSKTIVYAGNIGEGQGLHKIIPQAAKALGNEFNFLIIGDGGAKKSLQEQIKNLNITNVVIENPVKRNELIQIYSKADYLFIHLNDYPAFRKVLPSKIFELATFRRPILAGVSGFAAEFIKSEITDSFVFDPCDVSQLVDFLRIDKPSQLIERKNFISKFQRSYINRKMAESILGYI